MSWTVKKAEHCRIDAFKLWCWRRLLRVTWTARRSNHSILKVINPEYSLEGLMLKLKLHYFGQLMGQADSVEKTDAGKDLVRRGQQGWDGWMEPLTQWTRVWTNSGSFRRTRKSSVLQSMGLQRVWYDWAAEQQHDNMWLRWPIFISPYCVPGMCERIKKHNLIRWIILL